MIATLSSFLRTTVPVPSDECLVVAFSGGSDSTVLLWGLTRLAQQLGVRLHAAHFDHRLDPDSARRAGAAAETARRLGVDFSLQVWGHSGRDLAGSSLEARARDARYAFLERTAIQLDARWIATAHHADDQAETVLLRLLFGSGLHGLAGIRPVRGRVVRPLLGLERSVLVAALKTAGAGSPLVAVEDPTNRDLARPRNRIRHLLLPALERRDPGVRDRLCHLASAARAANERVDTLLGACLALRREPEGEVVADRGALERLPENLFAVALASMQRMAGGVFPPAAATCQELLRQLRRRRRVGCDSADGWRWEADDARVRLLRRRSGTGILTELFTYTLSVPGEVALPELRLRLELRRDQVADWMFRGQRFRAGLAADLGPQSRVVVRNRRPGDRIQPLGGPRRRLKDLLIEHRIPRQERDRLPLLVIDGEIAWVPGVTIGERFRLEPGVEQVWVAELEPFRA